MALGQFIIIDWGTSNFRAFLMDKEHNLASSHQENKGLLHVSNREFAEALELILKSWLDDYDKYPIFMAGMVGSKNGWFNVDYVATPANLGCLIANVKKFTLPWGNNLSGYIIPGVKHQNDNATFDVMRGEEVQALGFAAKRQIKEAMLILPGTHSKHVSINNNKIETINTFMSGELFSILCQHSILGKDLPEQQTSELAFVSGVRQSDKGDLSQLLFSARTQLLFDNVAAEHVHDYISGLIIGQELKHVGSDRKLAIIGGKSLSQRYLLACDMLDFEAEVIDGDQCFLAGMSAIVKLLM